MFLLDTNVVSEGIKKRPRPEVAAWLAESSPTSLYVSAVTRGEIRYGIEARIDGAYRRILEAWYPALVAGFSDRILPVDQVIAERWGVIRRRAEEARRSMPIVDLYLAATAEVHGLTLVTRNVSDFTGWGGPVHNPWRAD